MWHDQFRGVVVLVAVVAGTIKPGDKVKVMGQDDAEFEVKEVGIFLPSWCAIPSGLSSGRVGYLLAVNSKGVKGAFVGATIVPLSVSSPQLSQGVKFLTRPRPTVFASLYPTDANSFDDLKRSITRLALNDSSVLLTMETSSALGQGFRVGFLGVLHMDVFIQRLEDEFGTSLISTAPSVGYRCEMKNGTVVEAETPAQLPDRGLIQRILEPMVTCTIVTPVEHVGPLIELLQTRRGKQVSIETMDAARQVVIFRVPWVRAFIDLFTVA